MYIIVIHFRKISRYKYEISPWPKKTGRIFKIILRHYVRLGVIDAGAYYWDGFLKRVRDLRAAPALKNPVIQGTPDYLEKLNTGPGDEDFIISDPG